MDRPRFLLGLLGGVAGLLGLAPSSSAATVGDVETFRTAFVPSIEKCVYYPKWARANPVESSRWRTYRDAVIAGNAPAPPAMTTYFGRALVSAGVMAATADGSLPPPVLTIFPGAGLYPSDAAP